MPNCNINGLNFSNNFDWNNYLQIARKQGPPAARSYMTWTGLPLWNSIALQCIPDYYLGTDIEESVNLVNDAATTWQDAKKACPNDLLNQIQFLNYSSIIRCQHAMTDRPAMYSSIEGRSPMIDYRLVELMFSIPSFDKGEPGKKPLPQDVKRKNTGQNYKRKKKWSCCSSSLLMNKFGYHSKWMKCLKRNEEELSYVLGDNLISEVKKTDSKLHQHGSVTHSNSIIDMV